MTLIHKGSVIVRINSLFTFYYLEILTSEVVPRDDEVCASKASQGMAREPRRSCVRFMKPMHPTREQNDGSVKLQKLARPANESRRPIRPKSWLEIGAERHATRQR